MSTLLDTRQLMTSNSNCPSAHELLNFLVEKVAAVRRDTVGQIPSSFLPPAPATSDEFQTLSASDIQKILMSAPTKSRALDPLPTHIVKEFLPELLSYITDMFNASLCQGTLPVSQRHAIITPRLKKSEFDPADMKNYRPISNLTFMSTIVERLVCRQITTFLERNNLIPKEQSAYRRGYSTVAAVLKLIADFYSAADKGEVSLLGLLDRSAALDTINHSILINRVQMLSASNAQSSRGSSLSLKIVRRV